MREQAHVWIGSKFPSLNLQQPVDSKTSQKKLIRNDFYLVSVKTVIKYVIVRFESFLAKDQIWNVFYDNLIIVKWRPLKVKRQLIAMENAK